jgi:hypothetical protein
VTIYFFYCFLKDNENYDASTEMNHPIYAAANARGPPRRFFSESQASLGADNANYLNNTDFTARSVFNSNSNSSGSYSSHGQKITSSTSKSPASTRTSLSKTSGSCEDGGYLQAVPNPGPKFMTTAAIDLSDPKSVEFEEADNLNYLPGSHLTESECSK